MKLRILFAGIDGSGKTTCLDSLVSRLDPEFRVLRIGVSSPSLSHQGVTRQLVHGSFHSRVERLRETSIKWHFYGLYLIFNFLYKYLAAKYFEFFEKTDVVIFESDTLLHPTVYITYHFPITRILSPRLRFKIVNALFGSRKNVLIFYLDADPAISIVRIQRRGEKISPHENQKDLSALRAEFDRVLEVAVREGYDVVAIDANTKDADQVLKEAECAARQRLYDRA